jgi:Ni,Fe-hydrogenase I cytochrome b subunit
MLAALKTVTTGQWIVAALMIVLIVAGAYLSFRPYRAPAVTSNAPIAAPAYL